MLYCVLAPIPTTMILDLIKMKYSRQIQANIKCIDGSLFMLRCYITLERKEEDKLSDLDKKIKEQFPQFLNKALNSGFEITKLNLL